MTTPSNHQYDDQKRGDKSEVPRGNISPVLSVLVILLAMANFHCSKVNFSKSPSLTVDPMGCTENCDPRNPSNTNMKISPLSGRWSLQNQVGDLGTYLTTISGDPWIYDFELRFKMIIKDRAQGTCEIPKTDNSVFCDSTSPDYYADVCAALNLSPSQTGLIYSRSTNSTCQRLFDSSFLKAQQINKKCDAKVENLAANESSTSLDPDQFDMSSINLENAGTSQELQSIIDASPSSSMTITASTISLDEDCNCSYNFSLKLEADEILSGQIPADLQHCRNHFSSVYH